MSEREIVDSRSMTIQLILGFFLFAFLFSVAYFFTVGIIIKVIPYVFWKIFLGLLGEGIVLYLAWRISIKLAFRKKTIELRDIAHIDKNVTIFVLIIFALNFIVGFVEMSEQIKALNVKTGEIIAYEQWLLENESQVDLKDFQETYNKEIEGQKDRLRFAFYGVEAGLLAIHLATIIMVRRRISKEAERKVLHAAADPAEFVRNMQKERIQERAKKKEKKIRL